jgi:hypothetical protein
MLALLSAPRGRVSAARVAARLRENEQVEARGEVIRLPRVPAEPVAALRPLRALPAAAARGGATAADD